MEFLFISVGDGRLELVFVLEDDEVFGNEHLFEFIFIIIILMNLKQLLNLLWAFIQEIFIKNQGNL